jgi:hypothetical protein
MNIRQILLRDFGKVAVKLAAIDLRPVPNEIVIAPLFLGSCAAAKAHRGPSD